MDQLEEMLSRLHKKLQEVDVDESTVDDDTAELHMDFFLEQNGKKIVVCDRQYDGVSYSYHGTDYVGF